MPGSSPTLILTEPVPRARDSNEAAARGATRGIGRWREGALWDSGVEVAGVDEVGRGALAGPVVAAAVILPRTGCPAGLDDSKKLPPEMRLELFHAILTAAISVTVHSIGPRRIDEINILKASQEAMRHAVSGLYPPPAIALVDGLPIPAFPCPHEAIIGGDGRECCIAAASIVAKVTRDFLMTCYHAHYPHYQFHRHKGYGTPAHRAAIREHGLSPLHRRSFTSRLPISQQLELDV